MDYDDYEPDEPDDEEGSRRPHDRKIDMAKAVIMDRYLGGGANVYYARQIEIWMEDEFFHWITMRALNELAASGQVGFTIEQLAHHKAHFYYPVRHRYPRRQIKEIIGLIADFSKPDFTRAVGHYGELLIESGFARTSTRILQHKVRAVDHRQWKETNHDLDFLIERDGIRYGVEVKNQLGYIDQTEFQIKLRMCAYWGVRPMFVVRVMPKNYIYKVQQAGGFTMVTKNQNYPLLADALAKRVREKLDLPVGVIQRLPESALVRFQKWHDGTLKEG